MRRNHGRDFRVYLGGADINMAVDEIMPNLDTGQLAVPDDAALHLDLLQMRRRREGERDSEP